MRLGDFWWLLKLLFAKKGYYDLFYPINDTICLFRQLAVFNVLSALFFWQILKGFYKSRPNVLTLSLNNTLPFPSLINIFHITNTFLDEILNILLPFHSVGMWGACGWYIGST